MNNNNNNTNNNNFNVNMFQFLLPHTARKRQANFWNAQ
jgi:hypothetical protein